MRSQIKTCMVLFVSLFHLMGIAPLAGPGMLHGSEGIHEGAHVDLVVRKVMVTPVRAHVGDIIRIEMEWEYWGDISNDYYETTRAEVRANGKVVAGIPFTYEFGARLGEVYRETFLWDTAGVTPGKYRIRGEVPLRLDATPYDNYLDVKEPVLLVSAGASLPAGEEGGEAAVAENPFWVKH
ncbi:MAG: hypothetical protein WBA34_02375 [Candidatus Deferrimicrobiaceae bacterium]